MKRKTLFFILLLIIIIALFAFLYLIGLMNLFEVDFIKGLKWLRFDNQIAIFYLVFVSIFLIVIIAIMSRIILSLRHEDTQLTAMNIDDFSIQKTNNENFVGSFEKLVDSLNKNIDTIKKYTEVIDNDIDKMDSYKMQSNIQEKIDKLYQDFSHMINDIIQSSLVPELFEKILFWGVTFSNSKRGSLMVVDNNNKELYIYKTIGWTEEEKQKVEDIKTPLGSGISGKVAAENKRIFVTNLENYSDYDFKYKDKYDTKSFISLPIVGNKKVIAVLNLTENKNGLYTMNDLEALNIITKLASKIFKLIQLKKKLK